MSLLCLFRSKAENSIRNMNRKTRKRTRKFVIDGVMITTTTSKVIYGDDDNYTMCDPHIFRKQELRELKYLQKQEQKQFQDLYLKVPASFKFVGNVNFCVFFCLLYLTRLLLYFYICRFVVLGEYCKRAAREAVWARASSAGADVRERPGDAEQAAAAADRACWGAARRRPSHAVEENTGRSGTGLQAVSWGA